MTSIAHTHLTHSPSTNSALIDAIITGTLPQEQPQLYTAATQSAGRGQHGRSWLSPTGNVYLSLYLPMTAQGMQDSQARLHRLSGALSLCVGYELHQLPIITTINQARQQQGLPTVQVKWANDLGYYNYNTTSLQATHAYMPFFKLAGILIEPVLSLGRMLGVVVGVGLNVAISPDISDGLYQATSLYDLAAPVDLPIPSAEQLYLPIAQAIIAAAERHNQGTMRGGQPLLPAFIHAFNAAHALHEKTVAIFAQDDMAQPTHVGAVKGINADGVLLLLTATEGEQLVLAGMAKRLFDY